MSMINDSDIICEINQWLMEFYTDAFTFFEEVIDFFTMIWEYIKINTRNLSEKIINIIVVIPSWLIGLGIEFCLLCNRITNELRRSKEG